MNCPAKKDVLNEPFFSLGDSDEFKCTILKLMIVSSCVVKFKVFLPF